MSLSLINASAGTGEAVVATVSAARSPGSTTISVLATTNWPANSIATSGKPLSGGALGSPLVFSNHLSGANTIIIDAIAPGYTDTGNAVGDVIVLKPSTMWADTVATSIQNMWQTIYPVGCIYQSTASTNPGTTFGGTWVAFGAGRALVGVGTSDQAFAAGATGGESNHVLTIAELAAHAHGTTDPGHYHQEQIATTGGAGTGISGTSSIVGNSGATQDTGSAYTGVTINSAGSSTAHNNLQPYVVVYMWTRTA